jgi:voltage-gated potassium channel
MMSNRCVWSNFLSVVRLDVLESVLTVDFNRYLEDIDMKKSGDQKRNWRDVLFEVIFEADTPAGKWFDVGLIVCITASVAVVMLDSMEQVKQSHGGLLRSLEWALTILFTIEYILRLICVDKAIRYARSFFGIVDLLAIVPAYLSFLLPGSHSLIVIRLLRVLRIFRVLKLGRCVGEANVLMRGLVASRRKIFVFLFTVLTLVTIIGSLMYAIEGKQGGFSSIPRSVYWAIVTLTTVGYGDISPTTAPGQFLASLVMILGYSIIAVPAGIVTVEMSRAENKEITTRTCQACMHPGHDKDAQYCKFCGEKL